MFKYFLNAEDYAWVLPNQHECDICHKLKRCFDGEHFNGEHSYQAFCFSCVAEGRLKELGASGVTPDSDALKQQLRDLYHGKSEVEINRLATEINEELEYSTPTIPSWQSWSWPAHCGDYCQFIRIGGQADFNQLSIDGNGKGLFEKSLYFDLKDVTDVDNVWESLKPGLISGVSDPEDNWPTLAYIFKCLKCGEIITIWDCD